MTQILTPNEQQLLTFYRRNTPEMQEALLRVIENRVPAYSADSPTDNLSSPIEPEPH